MNIILHGYWRSTASYRVRIALNLKGLRYQQRTYNLRAGEQRAADYRSLSPQGLVPALETSEGILIQSPAILEWLEETFPAPPLLPSDPAERAVVRAMASIVGCDVHPLNNLRVLNCLRQELDVGEQQISGWIRRWIADGFEALESLIARHGAGFAFGATPTLADCYLVPQLYSAERFAVDTSCYPSLIAAANAAREIESFAKAHPSFQPDAAAD